MDYFSLYHFFITTKFIVWSHIRNHQIINPVKSMVLATIILMGHKWLRNQKQKLLYILLT